MINSVINESLICLDLQSYSKQDVFNELADLLVKNGNVNDKVIFLQDVQKRELVCNTCIDDGVAIPHAKSSAVVKPGVAVGISRSGVDYETGDNCLVQLVFLIASPEQVTNLHVELLGKISNKLLDESFMPKLMQAKTTQDALELLSIGKQEITAAETKTTNGGCKFFIGVTGCPTGVAHTYLAAEALEKAAAELGHEIKVETNGSIGVKNSPTAEDIARADAIIVCADMQVNLDRFAGKKLIKTSVKEPIRKARQIINNSLSAPEFIATGNDVSKESTAQKNKSNASKAGLYTYLMNGVSYMIPFVVTGGLLIAIALAIGGKPTEAGMVIPKDSDWNSVLNVGVAAFTLMIPVLAGFIAYAIGDRAALAPGFVGGWIANNGSFYHADAGTGFIGAIIAGLLAGYCVRYIASIKYHKILQPLVPIFIAPIVGTLFVAGLFIFVIGAPIASLMTFLNHSLQELSTGNAIILGIVLGGMAGFDMGGPFNKVAFLFSVGMIANGQSQFMGAMACAIPVAPLGMAIATIIGRKFNIFSETELEAGKAAGAMGLVGISEGAIPFAAQDPLGVIPANVVGSMLASVLAFMFGITDNVAHGGPVVALLGAMNKPVLALLCMLAGAFLTAIVAVVLKKFVTKRAAVVN